jgi:hypothetical protein
MRTLAFCLLAAGSLHGCAQAPADELTPAETAALHCITLTQVAGRRAVGPGTVLFETVGPNNYFNQLRGRCPPLERLGSTATISVASGGQGGQLCSGDRIRVLDPIELGSTPVTGYPTCVLGRFIAQPAKLQRRGT